jgi:hypothetical protein
MASHVRSISNNLIDCRLVTFQAPMSSPVSVLKSMRDEEHNGFHSAGRSGFVGVSRKRKLPYSPVHITHESSTGSSVVIDTMVCRPDMDTSAVISDVRDLAKKLSKTDPLSFNLLGCRGVVKNHRPILTEDTPVLAFDFILPFHNSSLSREACGNCSCPETYILSWMRRSS